MIAHEFYVSAKRFFESLFGRVSLILIFGLLIAHGLTLFWVGFERLQYGRNLMLSYLGRDIASSVAILNRVPQSERKEWLSRIERPDYRYVLKKIDHKNEEETEIAKAVRDAVTSTLGDSTIIGKAVHKKTKLGEQFELGIRLADESSITLIIDRPRIPISLSTLILLATQLLVLIGVSWLAVRSVIRPLHFLADAADHIDLNRTTLPLAEIGSSEVVRATRAFNKMRQRIDDHLRDRLRILSAISHDLQTPITRMRLRAELIEPIPLREKLQGDLANLQSLVEQGLAYAHSSQANRELPQSIDLNALLDGIVCDYVDAGLSVRLVGQSTTPLRVRALALKRLVINLLDNAIKFAGSAELVIAQSATNTCSIIVRDNGPGIPETELQSVMQPFYRIEASRNPDTGGAGLGLAIAYELAGAMGATLSLSNRASGGLEAELRIAPDKSRSEGMDFPSQKSLNS